MKEKKLAIMKRMEIYIRARIWRKKRFVSVCSILLYSFMSKDDVGAIA
ncbi:hypothetical protein HON22_01185 [Candidatus Peregrinibacteria bacterium]|jgi:hypothetical protein|nr:hypothetical protein [Candidatus Peregrinibacteria bacterium]